MSTVLGFPGRSVTSWRVAGRQLNKVVVFFFFTLTKQACAQTSPVRCKGNTCNVHAGYDQPSPMKSNDKYVDHTTPQRDKSHFRNLYSLRACLHGGVWPQIGEVTCVESPHLSCKRDQVIMRDYIDRRVTPPKRVTSPTWDPPPPCKQALKIILFFTVPVLVLIPKWYP